MGRVTVSTDKTPKGQRKPTKLVRLPAPLAGLLEELSREEVGTSVTEHVRNAVRLYLQSKGKIARPVPGG